MKKFIALIIVALIGVAGFDYYARTGSNQVQPEFEQPQNATENNLLAQDEKVNSAKNISTPGPLKFLQKRETSFLTRAGTINETNRQRQAQGEAALAENQLLNQAALAKVKDMFAGQYFEHISPLGYGPSYLAEAEGYKFLAVGENLALGNFKDDAELVEAWIQSPGHRENILSKEYTEIGVAMLQGEFEGKKVWLAVQEFGRPQSDCPVVNTGLKDQIKLLEAESQELKIQLDQAKANLTNADPETPSEVEIYNTMVVEFNNLVKSYNNKVDWLKTLTNDYNLQVKNYNECLNR